MVLLVHNLSMDSELSSGSPLLPYSQVTSLASARSKLFSCSSSKRSQSELAATFSGDPESMLHAAGFVPTSEIQSRKRT